MCIEKYDFAADGILTNIFLVIIIGAFFVEHFCDRGHGAIYEFTYTRARVTVHSFDFQKRKYKNPFPLAACVTSSKPSQNITARVVRAVC